MQATTSEENTHAAEAPEVNAMKSSRISDSSRYELVKMIGKGGMASVYLALDGKRNKKQVAIKKISFDCAMKANRALKEIWTVRSLHHENLVKYEDVYFESTGNSSSSSTSSSSSWDDDQRNFICIVMPLFNGGDLQEELKKRAVKQQYYEPMELWYMMRQITAGVVHLHENNILHRDLKPLNMFKLEDNRVVIGDFGLSRTLNETDSLAHTQAGTQKYMAPELLASKDKSSTGYDFKVDIWSLGVCFWELMVLNLTGVPYLEVMMRITYHQEIEDSLKNLNMPIRLIKLVIDCLNTNTKERPSSFQLLDRIDSLIAKKDQLFEPPEDDEITRSVRETYEQVSTIFNLEKSETERSLAYVQLFPLLKRLEATEHLVQIMKLIVSSCKSLIDHDPNPHTLTNIFGIVYQYGVSQKVHSEKVLCELMHGGVTSLLYRLVVSPRMTSNLNVFPYYGAIKNWATHMNYAELQELVRSQESLYDDFY